MNHPLKGLRPHETYMGDPRKVHIDNSYFNVRYTNESLTESRIITIDSTRNSEVISAASMYYLIVESFSIPSRTLPIFNFDNRTQPSLNPAGINPPPDNTYPFTVTANNRTRKLRYYDIGKLQPNLRSSTEFGPIYYIRQFTRMVNFAIMSAVNNANYDPNGIQEEIIYLSYDEVNQLFILTNPAGNKITNGDIYFSSNLFNYFSGFPGSFGGFRTANNQDVKILSLGDKDGDSIRQERKSLFPWNDIESILLFSTSLPVYEENFTNRKLNGNDEKFRVIATFDPYVNADDGIDRSDYRFFTGYPRLVDLTSDTGLDRVDFIARILRKNGDLEDIYILPGDQARLKLRFVKKAIFNNEYNINDLERRMELNPIGNYHIK